MRPVEDKEQAKRVGTSMELKQVHSLTDDDDMVDPGPKSDVPSSEDDDEDLEDRIAAAHHRFEDDIDTISLLSASSGRAERGISLSSQASGTTKQSSARVLGCVLIGIVGIAVLVVFIFAFTGRKYIPHSNAGEN